MTEITKKVYKKYFDKILSGEKKIELRLADEEYKEGDILILKEITDDRAFTGRETRKKIGYSIKTKGIDYWPKEDINKYGFIIMQLEDE